VTPPPSSGLNVRTRVHEYGGGEYLAVAASPSSSSPPTVYFSNFADQRLYKQALEPADAPAEPLTPEGAGLHFADALYDAARRRLVAVVEDHSGGEDVEAANYLAAIGALCFCVVGVRVCVVEEGGASE
jgi:hypothetical protein